MSKEKEKRDRFPHVKGLAKKRTKFGQRWILTEQDSTGKSRSITVKILDNDTIDVFYRKVSEARTELRRRDNQKTFESYFNEFCALNQLSKKTIESYQYALSGMSFNNRKNKELVRNLICTGKKSSTIALYLCKIKRFFAWCEKHGAPAQDPVGDIVIRDKHKPRQRIATESEIERILYYASKKEPEYRLFILLLINTGARVSSIESLRANDLVNGNLYLYNVKCDKPYDYPIPIRDELIFYLWNKVTIDGILWHGNPHEYTNRLRAWMFRQFGKNANGENLSPHSLRHTFATRAVQNGASVDVVSKLLDHASTSMTLKVYARFSQEQIDDAVTKAIRKKNACDCCDQSQASVSSSQVGAAQKKAASSEQN